MGQTHLAEGATESPVARLRDGQTDGYYLSDRCWGCYLHGILDNASVRDLLAQGFAASSVHTSFDYAAFKEEQYDKLAALVRQNVDMEYVYRVLGKPQFN